MLEALRCVLQARAEQFIVCSQLPLQKLRCDVVIVPRHARSISQLIVVELDGTDHCHKPRQYGMSCNEAYNATVDKDNKKARVVTEWGMKFVRLSRQELLDVDQQAWVYKLNAVLDFFA